MKPLPNASLHVFHDFMYSCQNLPATSTRMTNMKALPMLDHVALWYARLFTAFLLGREIGSPLVLIRYPSGHSFDAFMLAYLLWAVCAWCRGSELARLYLGLSAVVGMGIVLFFAENDAVTNGGWSLRGFLITGSIIGSMTPLIWTAIRPAQKPRVTRPATATKVNTPKRPPFFSLLFKAHLPAFR